MRLPFVGGVYGPNQGLFPKYDCGLYQKDKTKMIISAGLGNSLFPLRIFDNPQIVVGDKTLAFPDLEYKIKLKTTPYQSIVPIKYYKLFNGYSHQKFSAIDIMDSYDNIKYGKKSIIDPQIFKDKIVVIGANVTAGAGLNDNKNTPMVVAHPGVDIQATAIDNILHNDFLKVTPHFVNLLIVIFGMLMVSIA